MKYLLAAIAAIVASVCGAATNVNLRVLDYTNNVRFGSQQARDMLWYKGESVEYNVDVWRDSEQVAIPANATVIWQAWKSNNLSVLYISTTGQIVEADAGRVRATLTPAQANLASGAYNSALSLWDGTNYVGMAGVGQIRVVWTPAGDSLPYVGASASLYVPKPTNTWTAGYVLSTSDGGTTTYAAAQTGGGSGTLTNIVRGGGSSARLTVTNGAGPQATLSFDASGLSTGTPVYAESDPLWAAVSNSIAQRISSNATAAAMAWTNIATSGSGNAVTQLVASGQTLTAQRGTISASGGVQYQDAQGFTNSGGVVIGTGIADASALVVGNATSGPSCFAGGDGSQATGQTSIAYGDRAKAFGSGSVALGAGGPNAWGDGSIALGYGPDAYGFASVAIGENADARGDNAVALGGIATNTRAYSIGYSAAAKHADSFALGAAETTTNDQLAALFTNGYVLSGGPLYVNGSGVTNVNALTLGGYTWTNAIDAGANIAITSTNGRINIAGAAASGGAIPQIFSNQVIRAGVTMNNTNDIPPQVNWFDGLANTVTAATVHNYGGTNWQGAFIGGGIGTTLQGSDMQGAVILGGASNSMNGVTDISGVAVVGGEKHYFYSCPDSAIIAGARHTMIGDFSAVIAGTDIYQLGDYAIAGGRNCTNAGGNYGVQFGYQTRVELGANASFAHGDRSRAAAVETIAIGSRAAPAHRGAVVIVAPNGQFAVSGTEFPSTATNQCILGRFSGGVYVGETNSTWLVNGRRFITNATPTAITPWMQGCEVVDAGSNIVYVAVGLTTNDWRGHLLNITPP